MSAASHYSIDVTVLLYNDAGLYYAVAPALDIVGAGANDILAKKSFEIALDEFIKYTYNKGTFLKEFKRLGSQVPDNFAKKFTLKWPSPEELQKRPEWAGIMAKNPKTFELKVKLPF